MRNMRVDTVSNQKQLGRRIAMRRKEMRMTQTDLAKKINRSASMVGHWEKMDNRMSMRDLYEVASALETTPEELTRGMGIEWVELKEMIETSQRKRGVPMISGLSKREKEQKERYRVDTSTHQIELGHRIAGRREELGLTRRQLSCKIDCSEAAIHSWEIYGTKMSLYALREVANALQTTPEDLTEGLNIVWIQVAGNNQAKKIKAIPPDPDDMSIKPPVKAEKETHKTEAEKSFSNIPRKNKRKNRHWKSLDACLAAIERYNATHKPHLTYGKFMSKWEMGEITEADVT